MDKRNSNTALLVLVAVIIAAAVFASFGLPLFAAPTPTIVLPSTSPGQSSPAAPDRQGGGIRVDVTPDTVQSVIAALDRLECYSRQVTTLLEGVEITTRMDVDGAWTHAVTAGPLPCTTIVGEGRVWRWYEGDSTVISWPADDFSADLDGGRIPTYEDVLALDKRTITEAGYQEKNGIPCVYVQVEVAQLDQRESYWVSAENGLLVAAETRCGEETVWSMTATAPETPLSLSASGLFTLPDGTVLHRVSES